MLTRYRFGGDLKGAETLPKTAIGKSVEAGNLRLQRNLILNEVFLMLLESHTAGDPMDETKKMNHKT